MRSRLNTTTAIIASLSLIAPAPGVAQSNSADMALICPDGSAFPCPENMESIPTESPIAGSVANESAPEPDFEPESDVEQAAEPTPTFEPASKVVSQQPAQDEMIHDDLAKALAEEAAAASAAINETAPLLAIEPPSDEVMSEHDLAKALAPEAEASATSNALAAETERMVPADTKVEVQAPARDIVGTTISDHDLAGALAAEAESQATASKTVVESGPLVPDDMSVAAEATTSATSNETIRDDDLAKALAAEMKAEATTQAAEAEPDPVIPADAPATKEEPGTQASGDAMSDDDLAKALAAAVAEDTADEPVPVLPVQPDAASGEAPVAAAASAGSKDEVEATVTEEVVTTATTRSSSEDFANRVNEPSPVVATQAAQTKKKKSGLSNTEKAILIGLGGVAVGMMISNNRRVEMNSGDRMVVSRNDGTYQVIKDDDALLRQPGSTVRTETFADGSTRTIVTRPDGSQIVTIRDAEYRVLRRAHVAPNGRETLLIDDTTTYQPVDVRRLPPPARQHVISADANEADLRAALARSAAIDRRFSLAQVRDIAEVRALVPVIDLDTITFETGSAAIRPDQAKALSRLGRLIKSYIDENPREIFLIEGHTDAVGSAAYNLALSDRRAESVALALTEYFGVPPENMVVQGYGEEFLKINTQAAERANRRASVRRITDLLRLTVN